MQYGLTRGMRDCLLVIQELSAAGVAPNYDEIARELDVRSKGTVHRLVAALVARGHLAKLDRRSRSLSVLRPIAMPEEPEIVGFFEASPQLLRSLP